MQPLTEIFSKKDVEHCNIDEIVGSGKVWRVSFDEVVKEVIAVNNDPNLTFDETGHVVPVDSSEETNGSENVKEHVVDNSKIRMSLYDGIKWWVNGYGDLEEEPLETNIDDSKTPSNDVIKELVE